MLYTSFVVEVASLASIFLGALAVILDSGPLGILSSDEVSRGYEGCSASFISRSSSRIVLVCFATVSTNN